MTKRILVVEDQEDLRGVLRDLFASSGYTVIEAVDGAAGVARAKSDRPDIILMDIQMPIIDEGTNAEDRVVDMLGKLITHSSANFVLALTAITISGGEAFKVGDRLNVPNDDVSHEVHPTTLT